jgi:hypothetical protein
MQKAAVQTRPAEVALGTTRQRDMISTTSSVLRWGSAYDRFASLIAFLGHSCAPCCRLRFPEFVDYSSAVTAQALRSLWT